ncbi:MAG: Ig domain-containing protein, partial [Clostridia bacterium]|nr:Ig domain-containing protein [Clostridia bacterium]
MKKYSVATAVLALLLTLCLAGCTGQNKTTAEQAEDPSAAPGTSTSKEVPSSDPQESDPPLPSHAESTTPSKDTPNPKPNIPVSQIQLDSDKKTLNKGESFTLQATILPEDATDKALTYTSSDAAVANVDQNGKVTAQKAGTATITVKASSGVSAACTVTVLEQSGDPLDSLDLSGATEISDFDGYGTILRVKSTGEVMFSPNLIELQKLVAAGASYDDFTALMRFTCLAGGEFDTEDTFPTREIDPKTGKSAWVDFGLMGEDLDCGFCPTAGEHYNIEVAILKKNSGKCVIYGVYESIYADEVLKSSDYYDPTPSGATKREEGQYYIMYSASEGGSILGQARQLLDKDAPGSSVSAV